MSDIIIDILSYLWEIIQNLFRFIIFIYLILFVLKKIAFESKKVSGRFKIDKKFRQKNVSNLYDWRPINIELAKRVCDDCQFGDDGDAVFVDLGTGIREVEFSCKRYCSGLKHKDLGYFEGTLVACKQDGKKKVIVVRNADRKEIAIAKDAPENCPYGSLTREDLYNFVKSAGVCYPCWGSIKRKVSEEKGDMYYFGSLYFMVNPGLIDNAEINDCIRSVYEGKTEAPAL